LTFGRESVPRIIDGGTDHNGENDSVTRAKNNRKANAKRFDTVAWHSSLITNQRYRGKSSVPDRSIAEEAVSDRARVLYSSAFRRLQQRTQVFTVSKDAAVRTRLTHSLEVASVGRWIAQKVVDGKLSGLGPTYGSALVSLVETGCLAHDIGNPPFGHFGEFAIQAWFRKNWKAAAGKKLGRQGKFKVLIEDFLQFDGNPQGTRILTRLQGLTKKDRNLYGMDLTFSQVLTALKYPRGPKDLPSRWKKKPGFFESERPRVEEAFRVLRFKIQQRFPLAYFVEAADDISYCISDMEDGIDKRVFTVRDFFRELQTWIDATNPKQPALTNLRDEARERSRDASDSPTEAKDHFMRFKVAFTRTMIEEAARVYGDGGSQDICGGSRLGLLDNTDADDLLEALRNIAKKFLYVGETVQRPFLAGLRIVHGILDQYGEILKLKRDRFAKLRRAWKSEDRDDVHKEKLQTLLPLLDHLPAHYLDVYDFTAKDKDAQKEWGMDAWEWFCRAHLIVDYVSGMTDDFAYRSYQVISGAKLE
jgi:dGTPase